MDISGLRLVVEITALVVLGFLVGTYGALVTSIMVLEARVRNLEEQQGLSVTATVKPDGFSIETRNLDEGKK